MSEQQLTEARAALIRIARALGCDPGRDCVPSLIAAQCELEIAKLKNAADALADLTAVERENAELREACEFALGYFESNYHLEHPNVTTMRKALTPPTNAPNPESE
jgi:hypothetical protein